ncbi:hypothetical protein PVAG01_06730 [Phlyctema vagabunda]|uniref:Uncharacterized protein n=1 Tax=Phlyctema vagabunda TaxID=108571 RepID=A0ABR4PGZ0_9HELO
MNQLCKLLSQPLLSEAASAQQKSLVTYTISQLQQPQPAAHPYPNHKPEPSSMSSRPFPTISLLESRNLLFASGTTGLRTWEASLHLGNYLAWHPALIQGRSILELGAGTGYLSILCAKYLGAHAVLATDGSDGVVSSLATNIGLNDLESSARSSQSQAPFPSFPFSSLSQIISVRDLIWGDALLGTDDPVVRAGTDIDMVLGADVTYDDSAHEPLATTFNELLDRFPHVDILIAATERNAKTMRAFLRTCDEAGLVVHMVEYELVPRDQQMGPFYDDNVPIRLCFVKRKAGNEMGTPRERRDEHAVCTI